MENKDKPNATMENKDKPIFARGANLLRRRLKKVNEQLTLTALQAQEEAEQSAGRYRDLVEGLDAIVGKRGPTPGSIRFSASGPRPYSDTPLNDGSQSLTFGWT